MKSISGTSSAPESIKIAVGASDKIVPSSNVSSITSESAKLPERGFTLSTDIVVSPVPSSCIISERIIAVAPEVWPNRYLPGTNTDALSGSTSYRYLFGGPTASELPDTIFIFSLTIRRGGAIS